MLAGLDASTNPELMLPCPPWLEELRVLGAVAYFKDAALIPDIPSLRTLQLHCRKASLDVRRLTIMTALRSLCATTSDGIAAIGQAVPALTRLTCLALTANAGLSYSARVALSGPSHRSELSRVLRQLSALVSLRNLDLAGLLFREAQAFNGITVFPVLEVLQLQGPIVEANDGFLEFLVSTRSLAAVWLDALKCPGAKSALSAFRLAMARRIGTHVRVSVERWLCADESEGVWLSRGNRLDLHAVL